MSSQEATERAPDIHVWVAGHPVSVNVMYGNRRYGGGKRLTEEARDWMAQVAFAVIMWRINNKYGMHGPVPLRLPLRVRIRVEGVRGDVDNYVKLILDGAKEALAIDDKHVASVTCERPPNDQPKPIRDQGVWLSIWQADE